MTMKLVFLQLLVFVVSEAQNVQDPEYQQCVKTEILDVKREFTIAFADRLAQTETHIEKLNEEVASLNKENTELKQLLKKNTIDIQGISLREAYAHRSCHDWKLYGSENSGEYLIDPDGKGIGQPPVSVFCDMATGYTVVHHGSEKEQNVSSCSAGVCLTEVVDYQINKQQLRALVQVSEKCQQHVEIHCLGSPLFKDGRALSWWEDIHGNKQSTWFGSGCWCGEAKSCLIPKQHCNCDSALSGQWLVDSGYITDSSKLPVSKLIFGTSDSDSVRMRFKLGPLRCYGRKEVSYPESCRDLWLMGHSVSGYYNVGDPEDSHLEFCDMARVFQKDYKAQLSSQFSVVFYAVLNRNVEAKTWVKYDKVWANIGGGYEGSTGVFTAPVPGVYMFHVKSQGIKQEVQVALNGISLVGQHDDNTGPDSSSNNLPFIAALKKGDKIRVYLNSGKIQGVWKNIYWSSFSGFLLKRA